jgi:peroxiredoxin
MKLLVIGLLAGMLSTLATAGSPAPGSPAPDFQLKDLQGETVKLSDLRGKALVIHFWATWCPHCLTEMPLLQKLDASLRHEGAQILAINLGEPRKQVERYARERGLSFPILLDPRGRAAQAFGVVGLPTTILVDAEGRILRSLEMGSLENGDLSGVLSRAGGKSRP